MKKIISWLLFFSILFWFIFPAQIFAQSWDDKIQHFIAGAAISAIVIDSSDKNLSLKEKKEKALLIVFLIAVAKEAYDSNNGGRFDWGDVGATTLGALTITIKF